MFVGLGFWREKWDERPFLWWCWLRFTVEEHEAHRLINSLLSSLFKALSNRWNPWVWPPATPPRKELPDSHRMFDAINANYRSFVPLSQIGTHMVMVVVLCFNFSFSFIFDVLLSSFFVRFRLSYLIPVDQVFNNLTPFLIELP